MIIGKIYCSIIYRYRPWYIGTVTGPKNFILLVDFSGSMKNGDREKIIKSAVSVLLNNIVVD